MSTPTAALAGIASAAVSHAQGLVQAYAEANMTAAVTITRPVEAVYDAMTNQLTMGDEATIYTGKARVAAVAGAEQLTLADEPQFFQEATVYIPMGAGVPQVDDVLEVTAHGDPAVIGRHFRITDVGTGEQLPHSRRLSVQGFQPRRGEPL